MKKIIITLFLLSNLTIALSQTIDEIKRFKQLNQSEIKKNDYPFAQETNNEIDFIFSNLFLFYKKFISSQDGSSCSFTPSCSEYALQAIKKQGLIIGVINFFDRFSRCNVLSPKNYPIHPKTHLLDDPV